MAPTMSRLSKSQRKETISRILPAMVNHHRLLVDALSQICILDSRKSNSTIRAARTATFRFFRARIDYLMRNEMISDLVGVSKETFEQLLRICTHESSEISAIVRLSIFLKFCREGQSQSALSRDVGLSQPTLSRIIEKCTKDLVCVAGQFIRFPKSKDDIRSMIKQFATRKNKAGEETGIPCFGVLDGKHWACDHPPHSGSLNYNYKGFFSFNTLFVSDADTRILYVQISALGINSDAQLFRDGPLDSLLQEAAVAGGLQYLPNSNIAMPPFILADNGFGSSKQVMTPYRSNQLKSSADIKFNEIISASRVKIENLFGILTKKFQVFARNLSLSPENSRALIVACSVIHNISLGPRELLPNDPVLNDYDGPDPYNTAEEQRTALKNFVLNR